MEISDDRYYSMSITSLGPSTMPRTTTGRAVRITNNTADVEGATRTTTQYERYANKPSFLQSDVYGSTSKPLTHTRNTIDNCLYIDDIDGARARVTDKMIVTKRHVNPLQPEYDLPAFETVKPYEPKFLRHTMDFSDIEGTQSRPLMRFAPRDSTNRVDDIVGAQANWKARHDRVRFEREPKEIMHVDDISRRNRYVDKTERRTDLMNPVYQVNGMVSYDDPRYSKPKKPMPYFPESSLLRTKDINAGPDPKVVVRREYGRTNYIGDILGSESDSIKHSITTTRATNPLVPVYQSLDYGDALPPVLTPLMPFNMVSAPTLRPKLSARGDFRDAEMARTYESKQSRRASHGDFGASSIGNTFSDTGGLNEQNMTGYYESKGGNSARGDPVLFTEPCSQGERGADKRDHKYKLDLEIHQGNASARAYSGRGSSSNNNNNGYDAPGNYSGRASGRVDSDRGEYKQPSGRNSYRGENTSARGTATYGGNNSYSARNPGQSAGEKRSQRDRQEEINSVRNL